MRLEPLAASGQLSVDDVELGRFAPYYQKLVAFDIGSGRVKVGAEYHFEQDKTRAIVRVSDGRFDLENLALRRRGARDDFFKLAALGIHGAALDLDAHTVNVAEVVTHDARVRAARDAQGVVDLSTLVPATGAARETGGDRRADGETVGDPRRRGQSRWQRSTSRSGARASTTARSRLRRR